MNKKPTCPKCGKTEFICEPVSMPNGECWNPVICNSCATIVGQLPSNDEKEAMQRLGKILTVEEHLSDIKSLLLGFERLLRKTT